ncbi:MAG: D-lyxose/D-mannose family sugar isomerase [Bacteroidales bacterium]|nr:D-lyxose/D-mannose family sugar isomerase [Bacteroidales bacterium]
MKRSVINKTINEAIDFMNTNNFKLPAWAKATPEDWAKFAKMDNYSEIIDHQLGWDITDFGKNKFDEEGLTLFTIRNGSLKDGSTGKTYCEKIMIAQVNQKTPTHFHWNKMEDIINRGGGKLAIQLWKATADEKKSDESLNVRIDGVSHTIKAGEIVHLENGESITLEPYVYHCFWAEDKPCLIGEVSKVNDDNADNRFYESLGRFPEIEEDEPKQYVLCNEYPK